VAPDDSGRFCSSAPDSRIHCHAESKPAAETDAKLSAAGQRLVALAGDHAAALRSALRDVEDALQAKKVRRILDAARTAMSASDHCNAAMRERLRQLIAVRCGMLDMQLSAVNAALGGSPRWTPTTSTSCKVTGGPAQCG